MRHRYVFVGGLHRSGTSLVAGAIARHPQVGAIADAPVPEQEGVYLQGAIPHLATSGRPGAFAEDPAQHLTEGCAYDTLAVRERMEADWAPWFPDTPWRVEKSPVNLLRARLYQQLFPTSVFVFVLRHPLAVARATAKWSDRDEPALLAHWGTAHRLLAADLPRLHCYLLVRYEEFCADQAAQMRRIWTFLDLAPHVVEVSIDEPGRYLAPPAPPLPGIAATYGYLGVPPWIAPMRVAPGRHYYRRITERLQGPALPDAPPEALPTGLSSSPAAARSPAAGRS